MIRVLIVEDEQVIRSGIEKHVPWKEIGVDEIRTAENAEVGLQLCIHYQPQIIISDIKMPGMDGIELCTRFKQMMPDSQIIFISGFSDKEYLKAAITLGAISYVEKPLSVDELSDAIRRAVEQVNRSKREKETFFHLLLQPAKWENNDAKIYLNEINVADDQAFNIIEIKFNTLLRNPNEIKEEYNHSILRFFKDPTIRVFSDFLDENLLVVMITGSQRNLFTSTEQKYSLCNTLLCEHGESKNCFIALGVEVDHPNDLIKSFQSAQLAMKTLSYKGWNQFTIGEEVIIGKTQTILSEEQNRLHKYIVNKQRGEAEQLLFEIYQRLIQGKGVLDSQVRNTYFTLDYIFSSYEDAGTPSSQKILDHMVGGAIDTAQTIQELHEYIIGRMNNYFERSEDGLKSNYIVKKVIDYMNQNLDKKDISIKILADEVYVTPTYLSSLVKKTTGLTIGQYLTEIRIKRAEELLSDPQWKLYQIAEMVGYEDANYFAKTFKKKTGMLPSEYRESKKLL